MSSATANRLFYVGALVLCTLVPALGRAQDPKAVAQALFEEARKLMKDGKYAEACPKLQESQRLDPGLGTKLNLALCHEGEGKIATAWSMFVEARSEARKESDAKREQFAADHVAKLEPQLSRLTVTVSGAADVEGLEVTLDGTPLGRPSWGLALPIDPGEHTLAAVAPRYERWEQKVVIEPAASTQSVEIPALVPGPPEPVQPLPVPGEQPPPVPQPPPAMGGDTGTNDGSGQRIAGFVVGGVGVVAAIVGVAFGAAAISKEGDADDACPPDSSPTGPDGTLLCSEEAIQASDAAKTNALLSNVFLFGGIGLVGVGLVVVLTAPSAPEGAATATLTPTAGPTGGGAQLRVRF
jgi:hypothetical protein